MGNLSKPEHLDELLSGYEKPEDLLGEEPMFLWKSSMVGSTINSSSD